MFIDGNDNNQLGFIFFVHALPRSFEIQVRKIATSKAHNGRSIIYYYYPPYLNILFSVYKVFHITIVRGQHTVLHYAVLLFR